MALQRLNENFAPDQIVLGGALTGQLVASTTDLMPDIGREMDTPNYQAKQALVQSYYEEGSEFRGTPEALIHRVIYGPHEKGVSRAFPPGPDLGLAFRNGAVAIYAVEHW
jgi:hypothetical protein